MEFGAKNHSLRLLLDKEKAMNWIREWRTLRAYRKNRAPHHPTFQQNDTWTPPRAEVARCYHLKANPSLVRAAIVRDALGDIEICSQCITLAEGWHGVLMAFKTYGVDALWM